MCRSPKICIFRYEAGCVRAGQPVDPVLQKRGHQYIQTGYTFLACPTGRSYKSLRLDNKRQIF